MTQPIKTKKQLVDAVNLVVTQYLNDYGQPIPIRDEISMTSIEIECTEHIPLL